MDQNFTRQNLMFWAKINSACKVNNRYVLMLISGFKFYTKIPKECFNKDVKKKKKTLSVHQQLTLIFCY